MKEKMVSMDLIDTQWNVNEIYNADSTPVAKDLIDTQWNVNQDKQPPVFKCGIRFNRYIVECK